MTNKPKPVVTEPAPAEPVVTETPVVEIPVEPAPVVAPEVPLVEVTSVKIEEGTEDIRHQGSFLQKGNEPVTVTELPNGIKIEDY